MARVALLWQLFVALLQLANCRKLQQHGVHLGAHLEETSNTYTARSVSTSKADGLVISISKEGDKYWRQRTGGSKRKYSWPSAGTQSQDTSKAIAEHSKRRSLKKMLKHYADAVELMNEDLMRTYESSPPRRTTLAPPTRYSFMKLEDQEQAEKTMRTDYAPVRRKPPINNNAPAFYASVSMDAEETTNNRIP